MEALDTITNESIALLKSLIRIPSFSKEESATADLLEQFFKEKGLNPIRKGNNVYAFSSNYSDTKPTLWLNSHHDTVKPNTSYTRDPFQAEVLDNKLYGLGSNDAGGPLVSLIAAFRYLEKEELPFNLVLIASAEEEISGKNGIASLLPDIPPCDLAIVGEPSLGHLAIAEKGLMVIDAQVEGKAGHAAREEGINAIYLALKDLETIQNFEFERVSSSLGKSKVSATVIQAGKQHNVVPDLCEFTLDVRVTDAYTLEEALEELKSKLSAKLTPRSTRLQSSHIPIEHPIISVAKKMNLQMYGSPTLSDQALIPYPSVKIGPGDSGRSHSADEYIFLNEIQEGVKLYIALLENYAQTFENELQ